MWNNNPELKEYFSGGEDDEDNYSEFSEKTKQDKDNNGTTTGQQRLASSSALPVTHVTSPKGEDEEDSYGSKSSGKNVMTKSAQDLTEAALQQELKLVQHLQEREKQRTEKAQALTTQPGGYQMELQKKFDRLVKRALELGVDAKLGFADPQEYTEEECFRLGAQLRESESELMALRTQTLKASQDLTRREYEYDRLFNPQRREVEERLIEFNNKLQAEEEKGSHLNSTMANYKERFGRTKEEAVAVREVLLEKLAKDGNSCKHICIPELVRLLLQQQDTAKFVTSCKINRKFKHQSQRTTSENRSLKRLMTELEYLKAKNTRLKAAVDKLHGELESANKASGQVRSLKQRVVSLLGKQMKEKNLHFLAKKTTEALDKKVVVLSDHIERLMLHLKHEATDKARAHEVESLALKETDLLRSRITALAKKNLRKDTVIVELQEGERILEDQLRLMDGKYMELRKVLNETRSKYKVELDKYVQEAGRLRVRWEKETQGAIPIEYVPLPRAITGTKARTASQPYSAPTGLDRGDSRPLPAAAMVPPLIPLVPQSPSSTAGEPPEPWSDEKLMSLQQNIQIQKQQLSGKLPTTGPPAGGGIELPSNSSRSLQPSPSAALATTNDPSPTVETNSGRSKIT